MREYADHPNPREIEHIAKPVVPVLQLIPFTSVVDRCYAFQDYPGLHEVFETEPESSTSAETEHESASSAGPPARFDHHFKECFDHVHLIRKRSDWGRMFV